MIIRTEIDMLTVPRTPMIMADCHGCLCLEIVDIVRRLQGCDHVMEDGLVAQVGTIGIHAKRLLLVQIIQSSPYGT